MDFAFTDEQNEIAELAKKILRDQATPAALAKLEQEGGGFHRAIWEALAEAGLLGIALPEAHGGGGMGLTELCLVLQQVGKAVAPVPALACLAAAALPVARFGSDAQKAALLPEVAAGRLLLTAALVEPAAWPAALRDGDGYSLSGSLPSVPTLPIADRVLVPARAEGGELLVLLVDPRGAGATVVPERGTDAQPIGRLDLAGYRASSADVLGAEGEGGEVLRFATERAQVGGCAVTLGVVEAALHMTARYATERKQFGRAIGTFQAVQQRAADAYIDVESLRLVVWRTVWLLDNDRDATPEVLIAKQWAADAGHRVTCAAQHLHGGMGFDRDYPLFRYFLWAKQLEMTLGSASAQLARLGDLIAETA